MKRLRRIDTRTFQTMWSDRVQTVELFENIVENDKFYGIPEETMSRLLNDDWLNKAFELTGFSLSKAETWFHSILFHRVLCPSYF